jgi:hypothetical protein
LWHWPQASEACRPASGNFVSFAWSNGADAKPVSLWHAPQSCLNCPWCTSTWQAAHRSALSATRTAGCLWQLAQGTDWCRPTRAKDVRP